MFQNHRNNILGRTTDAKNTKKKVKKIKIDFVNDILILHFHFLASKLRHIDTFFSSSLKLQKEKNMKKIPKNILSGIVLCHFFGVEKNSKV